MPCRSDYQEPSERERESAVVLHFLKELGFPIFNGAFEDPYGRPHTLDIDTAKLCYTLEALPQEHIKNLSLELQIWWRDHQIADQRREMQEHLSEEKEKLKKQALSKLSSAEKEALGL